ncbi:hypothetical protein [Methylobacterium sp. J-070]|nr:hypothetical protein [Methylobacterium sp. J-070]MCJ2051157.1 hypothetical protein [Methylobacterium sp. J-070]
MSFEREVIRRIGRPVESAAERYESASLSNDPLTGTLRELGIFEHV